MSTKIYNGFVFEGLDLTGVHEVLLAFRRDVYVLQRRLEAQTVAADAVDILDRRLMGRDSGTDSPLVTATDAIWTRQDAMKKTGARDPEVDYTVSLTVLPYEGKVYGIYHIERSELVDLLKSQPWFHSYGWWNNTDKPDDVSSEEWEQRERIWDAILDRDPLNRPAGCGFSVDIHPVGSPEIPEIMAELPSVESRARRLAIAMLIAERLKEQFDLDEEGGIGSDRQSEMFAAAFRETTRIMQGEAEEELKVLMDDIKEIILPVVTQEMLIEMP